MVPFAPHTPPAALTPLVGREREVDELVGLLDRTRLLTLTGAGGSGKTRLAQEVLARRCPGSCGTRPDPCWVELAPLTDPAALPQQVIQALGVPEEIPSADPAAILPFLENRPVLLVLDNCEHLVEACAAMVQLLLAARPQLGVLATSQEALGVMGERVWLVPPLALPRPHDPPEVMEQASALRLFLDRARDVSREFALTPENTGVVADICRRLDGIPLAIELAAARVRLLSLEQIRDRLNDAFSLLTAGGRRIVPRHRTLRAAVDWSHGLLPEPAQVLLRRVSVFRGGFTLDGALAIGTEGDGDPLDGMDLVALLVDRSLLQMREVDGVARYGMLETIRQYGALRLAEAGEEEVIRERHARFVAAELARSAPRLIRLDRHGHMARLLREIENIRDALAWTRANAPDVHVVLVADLWWFWFFTRYWEEAGAWIRGALALPEAGGPTLDRARLLFAAGALATLQARVEEGRPYLEEAGVLAEEVGEGELWASVQNYLALSYGQLSDLRMREYAHRGLAWFRAHPDDWGLRLALMMNAIEAHFSGDPDRADLLSAEAVEIARRGGPADLAIAYQNWSLIWAFRGDYERAEPLVLASLAALRDDRSYLFLARGIAFLGEVAGLRGNPLEGARLLGTAHSIRESIGTLPFAADMGRLARVEPLLRAAAGEEAFETAFLEGASMGWETVIDSLLEGWEPEQLERAVAAATRGATQGHPPPNSGAPLPNRPPSESSHPAALAPALPSAPAPALPSAPVTETGRTRADGSSSGRVGGAAPALRILTLGSFELEGETVEAGGWSYARPRELLLFLLLHPRGVTRNEIGDAIWPDSSPVQVKNSFHVTLHHLRKRLGDPAWIILEGERYRLARERGVEWDAETFQEELRAALQGGDAADPVRLTGILALYRGPLLDGSGGGRWIEDARDHYHRLFVDGLLARARALQAAGDGPAALDAWSRVLAEDELNEEAHRGVMLAWASAGARERALRHYERLIVLFREVLDAAPEAATVRLHEELAAGGRVKTSLPTD